VVTKLMAGASDVAPMLILLKFLGHHMRPSLFGPKVWLWILGNSFKEEEATTFAEKYLKQYVVKVSMYIPCKIKNRSSCVVQPPITLLFLIRKGKDGIAKWQKYVKKVYDTFENTFYTAFLIQHQSKA